MDSRWSRRGQSASSTAILIAIIGAFLVLYILFLPPQDRESLLFGNGDTQDGGGTYYGGGGGQGVFTQYGPLTLLAAAPGTLRLQKFPVQEHSVPSATIFTSIRTEEVKSIDSAIVKNGVFSSQPAELTFAADRQSSQNYLLSFNIQQAGSTPLRVKLNGKLLQERPMAAGTPPPISLPMDYLVDGENTVTIETSSVGLAFWKPNAYFLTSILVSADLIDASGSVSEQRFSLEDNELASMERAELQFVPECDPRNAGRLLVHLNARTVTDANGTVIRDETGAPMVIPNLLYNGYVDCGVLFKTDVPREHLNRGENILVFASQGGQYVVDRIKLVVYLQENDYPTYYFNLNPELYDSLDQGHGALRLTLRFTDYRNDKRGEMVVNGFVQSFQTNQYVYQALIDPAIITPGPNTIQVVPHVDKLDIAEMKVELI